MAKRKKRRRRRGAGALGAATCLPGDRFMLVDEYGQAVGCFRTEPVARAHADAYRRHGRLIWTRKLGR